MRRLINTFGKVIFPILAIEMLSLKMIAENLDTLSSKVPEVKVTADRILSIAAIQYNAYNIIGEEELRKSKAWQLSEIINTIPGLFINDYGGLGGLKTVSMRGTSSSQNIIMIDGIKVNASQTGLTDLGSFSIGQFNNIEIARGGASAVFGGSAIGGIINLTNNDYHDDIYKAEFGYGSFGEYNIYGSAIFSNDNVNELISINFKHSNGDYPFRFGNKNSEYNRANSDYYMGSFSSLTKYNSYSANSALRIILNSAGRGIPGPFINDVNLIDISDSRLKDGSAIVIFSNKYLLDDISTVYLGLNTNINNYKYSDADFFGTGFGGLNVNFTNRDFGANAKLKTQILNFITNFGFEFSFSDLRGNQIDASAGNYVKRSNIAAMLNAESDLNIFDIGILNYSIGGRIDNFSDAGLAMSEYLGAIFNSVSLPLKVRVQISGNFRPPSFNEMYYLNFGNSSLKPESSISFNLGAVLTVFENINFQIDGFYINTENQVVAVPKSQISWSAENISEVTNLGVEFSANSSFFDKTLSINFSYTLQDVRDNSIDGNNYGKLIVYTPQELFNTSVNYRFDNLTIGSTLRYSGFYYSLPDNSYESIMPSYLLFDIFIGYELDFDFTKLNFRIECKNILNEQYAVILNYPMPGRYFRAGITIEL